MDFFEASSFKELVGYCVPQLKERGVYSRIAKFLNVSNVYVGQVFKSDKHLSFEQAMLVAEYFGFNTLQTQYFMHLVALDKAGHFKLANYHKRQLEQIREQSKKIASRAKSTQTLSLEDQVRYYSHWKYPAFQLACSLPEVKSVQHLAEMFNMEVEEATRVLNFLLDCRLVIREKDQFKLGVSHIHLPKESPLLSSHHRNWRLYATEKFAKLKDEEIMYTAPMVISKELRKEFQATLLELIQSFVKKTEGCPDEELRLLSIDFIKI